MNNSKLNEPEKYHKVTFGSESGIGASLILILQGKEPGRILFKNHCLWHAEYGERKSAIKARVVWMHVETYASGQLEWYHGNPSLFQKETGFFMSPYEKERLLEWKNIKKRYRKS